MKWKHKGKTYDTDLSKVLGTKVGEHEDFDRHGTASMFETLYRTEGGEAFAHNVTTLGNGKVEHSMFICTDGGKSWMATLKYSQKRQH